MMFKKFKKFNKELLSKKFIMKFKSFLDEKDILYTLEFSGLIV